jgi:benzoate-CoA ligase family protein
MAHEFNAAAWLVDRHVEQGRGERTAVRGSQTLTYAELAQLSVDVASSLRRLGLRRDERVVFVMSDGIELLGGILGAFRAGVVAVPVSTMLGAHELAKILADSGARLVCTTHEYVDAVTAATDLAPDVEHFVLAGADPLQALSSASARTWEDFIALGRKGTEHDRAVADTDDDTCALWLYTSGTTGSPKGAMHRHANIRHVCQTYGDQVLGIQPDDVCFSVAKLFFAYGLGNSAFFPLSVGATTVLEPRHPTPQVIAERLSADKPTIFGGVPTFFASLVASDLADDAFSSVRLATSAGEPLPAPLQRRFTDRFGVEIIDGIGCTESLNTFLSNRPGDIRPGTTGRPVPGYQLQLRDATGGLVPQGQPGTLHVRGESIAQGYWRRTVASRQVFVGEWLNTGDTYLESQDGYYTCLGRSSDLIKAGGIWVTPSEVENRLLEHPLVAEAAVVGSFDADGLAKPVACVVTRGPVTRDELIRWCRDELAHFKCPRAVVFVDELPKTATGKLQRFRVRELVTDNVSWAVEPSSSPGHKAGSSPAGAVAADPLARLCINPKKYVDPPIRFCNNAKKYVDCCAERLAPPCWTK